MKCIHSVVTALLQQLATFVPSLHWGKGLQQVKGKKVPDIATIYFISCFVFQLYR